MILFFSAPGKPVAKGRPRFSRRGNFVKTFTDEKTMRYEDCIAFYAREAMGRVDYSFPIDAPVKVGICATFQRPKSRKAGCQMDRKPDLDNVCKAVLDGISNAGAITNDSRVVEIQASKQYGDSAETVVWLDLCPSSL